MEPAAVLVAALEVHVGGPLQFRPNREHGLVAGARVEPHVEDVALALEVRAAAVRAGEAVWQELLDRTLVPGVRAMLQEDVCRACGQRGA